LVSMSFRILFFLSSVALLADTTNIDQRLAGHLANERYSSARQLLLQIKNPSMRVFWQGSIDVVMWQDLQIDSLKQRWIKQYGDFAELPLEGDRELFFKGIALGQLGGIAVNDGAYFAALSYSRESFDLLEKIPPKSQFYTDAQTAMAIYEFWMAKKLPLLDWMTLRFPDVEALVAQVSNNAKKCYYTQAGVYQQLFWMYFEMEDTLAAKEMAFKYAAAFPGTRVSQWLLYFYHSKTGAYAEAIATLDSLYEKYLQVTPLSRYHLFFILFRKYELRDALEHYDALPDIEKTIEQLRLTTVEKNQLEVLYKRYSDIRSKRLR
jgi:tetratricopeptide (TPR) repeat protein